MAKFLLPLLLSITAPLGLAASDYKHPVLAYELQKQESYSAQRRFSGRALSPQHSALAFEQAGRVDAVFVDAGQSVKAGDVLVKLDVRLLETQAEEVKAAIAENAASLDKARQDLSRQRSLQSKGYSAQQAIDDLRAREKVLLAQREKLDAQRRGVEIRLQKSTLLAPFDGEIVSKFVDVGVIVKEGQAAMDIVESGHREAVIGIPESLRSSIVAGDQVTVRGPFGETQARVVSVPKRLNPGTLTHSVRIAFDVDVQVADGSIVYMLLDQVVAREGFWVPLSALLEGYRGTWAVYALKPAGEAGLVLEKHSVSPIYQEGDRVFVSAELASNSSIVGAGVHRFAAGQHVIPAGE